MLQLLRQQLHQAEPEVRGCVGMFQHQLCRNAAGGDLLQCDDIDPMAPLAEEVSQSDDVAGLEEPDQELLRGAFGQHGFVSPAGEAQKLCDGFADGCQHSTVGEVLHPPFLRDCALRLRAELRQWVEPSMRALAAQPYLEFCGEHRHGVPLRMCGAKFACRRWLPSELSHGT